MEIKNPKKVIVTALIVVVSFVFGYVWGSHSLPFRGKASYSSASVSATPPAKPGVHGVNPYCNTGWWWYYRDCYR